MKSKTIALTGYDSDLPRPGFVRKAGKCCQYDRTAMTGRTTMEMNHEGMGHSKWITEILKKTDMAEIWTTQMGHKSKGGEDNQLKKMVLTITLNAEKMRLTDAVNINIQTCWPNCRKVQMNKLTDESHQVWMKSYDHYPKRRGRVQTT
jgi:hypothetical protein